MEEIREHCPVCPLLILSLTVVKEQRTNMINNDMVVWTHKDNGAFGDQCSCSKSSGQSQDLPLGQAPRQAPVEISIYSGSQTIMRVLNGGTCASLGGRGGHFHFNLLIFFIFASIISFLEIVYTRFRLIIT